MSNCFDHLGMHTRSKRGISAVSFDADASHRGELPVVLGNGSSLDLVCLGRPYWFLGTLWVAASTWC